jgi:hypothetical protein
MTCRVPEFAGEIEARRHFENYVQSVSYAVPCYYRPTELEDISRVIVEAEARNARLRVCGSGWSFEDICHSDDMMVDLGLLNNQLTSVTGVRALLHERHLIPGLTRSRESIEHWRGDRIRSHPGLPMPRVESAPTSAWLIRGDIVHVEAGISLFDLNLLLDDLDRSIPTLGGSQGQTLAGAFSTSTHGSDFQDGPLSDYVIALHLVTSRGRHVWIESVSRPVTRSDDALRAVLPAGAEIIRDDEALNAVTVGLGRFGVIYSAVIEVLPEHALQEWTSSHPISEVLSLLQQGVGRADPLTPLIDNVTMGPGPSWAASRARNLKFLDINMSSRPSDNCWIRRRWVRAAAPSMPVPPHDPNISSPAAWAMLPGLASAIVDATLGGLATASLAAVAIASASPIAPIAAPIAAAWATKIGSDATAFMKRVHEGHAGYAGDAIAQAINTLVMAATEFPWPLDSMRETLRREFKVDEAINIATQLILSGGFPVTSATTPNGRVARSWNISAGSSADSGAPHFRVNSMEVVFGAQSRAFVDFVNFLRDQSVRFIQTGTISIRFTRPARALLSMHNVAGPLAISIEVTSLRGVRDNDAWFRLIRERALSMGGRLHWGQQNSLSEDDTRRLYRGNFSRWKDQLVRIAGASPVFSNNFTRQRGLEPGKRTRLFTQVRRSGGHITHLVEPLSRWREVSIRDAIRQMRENTVSYTVIAHDRLLTLSAKRVLRTTPNDRTDDDLERLPEIRLPPVLTPGLGPPPPLTLLDPDTRKP